MRRGEEYVGSGVMKRGRPSRRWIESVKEDLREWGFEGDENVNRAEWRRGNVDFA